MGKSSQYVTSQPGQRSQALLPSMGVGPVSTGAYTGTLCNNQPHICGLAVSAGV